MYCILLASFSISIIPYFLVSTPRSPTILHCQGVYSTQVHPALFSPLHFLPFFSLAAYLMIAAGQSERRELAVIGATRAVSWTWWLVCRVEEYCWDAYRRRKAGIIDVSSTYIGVTDVYYTTGVIACIHNANVHVERHVMAIRSGHVVRRVDLDVGVVVGVTVAHVRNVDGCICRCP